MSLCRSLALDRGRGDPDPQRAATKPSQTAMGRSGHDPRDQRGALRVRSHDLTVRAL
jgi:hypothetical protein